MPTFGSLAPETEPDGIVPPPANPARPPQAILDLLHSMFVQPVQDAGRALQGKMTPDEAQNFALEAAAGFIPISRAVKPIAAAAKGMAVAKGPDQYVHSFNSVGGDRAKFDEAFAALKADKTVNKDALTTISQTYGLHVYNNLSKERLLDEIEKAFVRKARFENKLK